MDSNPGLLDIPLRKPRIDALPEYTDYADNGCDLYPSCLHCPLPRCRYEQPGGAAAMLRTGRDASIIRLAEKEGVSVDELARMFGISRRTVFRVLRTARGCRRKARSPRHEARDKA